MISTAPWHIAISQWQFSVLSNKTINQIRLHMIADRSQFAHSRFAKADAEADIRDAAAKVMYPRLKMCSQTLLGISFTDVCNGGVFVLVLKRIWSLGPYHVNRMRRKKHPMIFNIYLTFKLSPFQALNIGSSEYYRIPV